MRESTRNEIIRLHYGGASQRRIAKLLGVARKSVSRVLVGHEQLRAAPIEVERRRRPSRLRKNAGLTYSALFSLSFLESECH
jgi:transposase